MKQYLPGILAALVIGGVVYAGSIKSWSNGEVMSATDINTNFSHIHGTMVGGHGARLVDADVSASAAITHSKMATPSLLPKIFVAVNGVCGASPCTITLDQGVNTVTRGGPGAYVVNFDSNRSDAVYTVTVSAGTVSRHCVANTYAVGSVNVTCYDMAGVATDSAFSLILMDNT